MQYKLGVFFLSVFRFSLQYISCCVFMAGISIIIFIIITRGCLLSGYSPGDKCVAAAPKKFRQCYGNHPVTSGSKFPSSRAVLARSETAPAKARAWLPSHPHRRPLLYFKL